MALTQITGPYPIFTDLDGTPLDDGYLYIGSPNDDPEINPVQVFWDSALTIPATQPIRTSNGYAWRNGTPGLLYTGGTFSITVRNKKNEFVLYSPLGYGFDPVKSSAIIVKNDFVGDGVEVDFAISSAPSTILATNVFFNGIYQEKETYTLFGNTITFNTPPGVGVSIEVITNETGVISTGNATAISYTLTEPGAVNQTVQTKLEETISVKDFGAVGDGVTNDRLSIIAAIDALKTNGGGSLLFPNGTYLISGMQQVVNIPELNGSLAYVNTPNDVQIYVQDANNINFIFDGAILESDKTNGGYTLLFDGCSNLTFKNLHMQGATVMSGSTPTVNGTNGIGFLSLTQDSQNITFENTKIEDHYSSIDIAGDPASSFRVTNVTLSGSTYLDTGVYGISCRGNGVNVSVENLYSYQQNRGFFVYDTQQFSVAGTIDYLPSTGFDCLVKAYTENTFNIKIDCVFKNKANVVTPRLSFQSQHNPAIQPTPAYVSDVFVRYSEVNSGTGGTGINFAYFQNSTLTATCNNKIFDNFVVVGSSSNLMKTQVTLSINAICNINVDAYNEFVAGAFTGKGILDNTGFVGAKRFTYQPSLRFGGNDTGMTYTLRSADYYVQGGFCTVIGRITLLTKGSSTGSATILMPFYSREDTANNPVGLVIGQADMAGLTGPIVAFVTASAGNILQMLQQGATGTTGLTHANFTDTSRLLFQATYPV